MSYEPNTLNFIMRLESGEPITQEEAVEGFQALINSGLVWQLQGMYGRAAHDLIEAGLCTNPDAPSPEDIH